MEYGTSENHCVVLGFMGLLDGGEIDPSQGCVLVSLLDFMVHTLVYVTWRTWRKQFSRFGLSAGKKYTLSALDPVNMEDVPPAAVRLGAGELALRVAKEKLRQESGLGDLLNTIPRRRMHGKPGGCLP